MNRAIILAETSRSAPAASVVEGQLIRIGHSRLMEHLRGVATQRHCLRDGEGAKERIQDPDQEAATAATLRCRASSNRPTTLSLRPEFEAQSSVTTSVGGRPRMVPTIDVERTTSGAAGRCDADAQPNAKDE